ncbi:RtcB family protein [Sphaerisporangium perillae]|uniref:RtcB family protein n=1 Tax=Sphaerisporangium perillae TaxID=2935860 RepID=UPI00200FBD2D|nr:RtcB family protein [Sphaerisporangium perillae]
MPNQVAPNLLSWASEIDAGTIEQAARTARLRFVSGHVALMPDAHIGIGATVGSVIPTEGAIIPAAVGVDIGCGMVATETTLTAADLPDTMAALMPMVEHRIPAGVGKGHADPSMDRALSELGLPHTDLTPKQVKKVSEQFGTLGSGNHFVEVCLDERDRVWTVLHSGSRGIGNQLATMHIVDAKKLMKQQAIGLEDPDLAYLIQSTPEFTAYIEDMLWAQRYAMASRARMDRVLINALFRVVGKGERVRTINCFSGETGVLTSSGVRPIAELAGGIHELLTTDGEWVKAPVQSFGRQPVMRVRLSRNGVKKDIYATPEHRWLLRTHSSGGTRYWGKRPTEVTTAELKPGDRLAWTFPKRPDGMVVDKEGAARGFVFGDGAVSPPNRSPANFCGEKDLSLPPFFEGFGRPPRTYPAMKVINGLPLERKTCVPGLDCGPSYLYGWVAGYFAADGDVGKTGRPTLVSAVRENLEQVRRICGLLGIGTYGIRTRMTLGYNKEPAPMYLMGLMRGDLDPSFFLIPAHRERFQAGRRVVERRGWTVSTVEETDRVEEVFCAVVEGTHAFALEDNILTRNCHHNFTQMEKHNGRDLWITRKGAIKADVGDEGVIPGSMGTQSYIVRGRGNPDSYNSCSHGAGRRMSRTRAKRELSAKSLTEAMRGRTWNANRAAALVDEHPDAYKSIDQVMEDQKDLVEIQHTLHQIFNYKG